MPASLHPVNKVVLGCENVFWTLSHLGIGRSLDFAIRRGKVRVGPAGSDKMRRFPTNQLWTTPPTIIFQHPRAVCGMKVTGVADEVKENV
jgi:hypothetical protein